MYLCQANGVCIDGNNLYNNALTASDFNQSTSEWDIHKSRHHIAILDIYKQDSKRLKCLFYDVEWSAVVYAHKSRCHSIHQADDSRNITESLPPQNVPLQIVEKLM